MKSNRKTFVPNLTGYISGEPGKGQVRYESATGGPAKIISNVKFNEFEAGSSGKVLIDAAASSNQYTFQAGIPDDNLKSNEAIGVLIGHEIYTRPVITHKNFKDSTTKMVVEYNQQCLSFGSKYQPARTFVRLNDVASIRNPATTATGRTIMLRIMIDNSRSGASDENKAVLALADRSGTTSFQINVSGAGAGNLVLSSVVVGSTSNTLTFGSGAGETLTPGKWYTAFFRQTSMPAPSTLRSGNHSISVFNISDGVLLDTNTSNFGVTANAFVESDLSMFLGYGELSGGLNVDYTLSDFVSGVHLAEIAIWDGVLSVSSMSAIASAHLSQNQYESGINSRPVKRVQQIYDSMNSYPKQQVMTGDRLISDAKYNLYDSTKEETFGATHPELMVYPEMIPARLYSGSGGTFHHDASYDSTNVQIKDGQFKDIRNTPFQFKMLATGAMYSGIAHKETKLLNDITVAGYQTSNSITGSTINALGGTISPFNDDKSPDADVLNEKGSPFPGFDQRLGDLIRIEIPIPTAEDAIMGVDPSQGRIASMAYYNFDEGKWERKFMPGISGSNVRAADQLSGEYGPASTNRNSFWEDTRGFLLNSCSIGFGGTAGFSIYVDEAERALMDLKTRGRPTSTYGFPHLDQYVATSPQTLKISDYIDGPFLLEKMAVEFDGEIEEAGPGSIATKIKTPDRWRQAVQWYIGNHNNSSISRAKQADGGVGAVPVFYRSVEGIAVKQSLGPDQQGKIYATPEGGFNATDNFPTIGASRYQLYFTDPGVYGDPNMAAPTANSHTSQTPIFIGGSTTPAYAEFLYQHETQALTHGMSAAVARKFGHSFEQIPDNIAGRENTDKNASTVIEDNNVAGRWFNNSWDRMFAIQDTTNDPNSWSGAGRNRFRGRIIESNNGGPGSISWGLPDIQRACTGYYSSMPSMFSYYNVPAGIFLPQIERAPSNDSNTPRGRKDGGDYGGLIKLMFGGISGLVTGSYIPRADGSYASNYYSSGSDPRTKFGGTQEQRYSSRWGKSAYLSQNFINFVDSFSIDATGNMTSTTNTARGTDPTAVSTKNKALGTPNMPGAISHYFGQSTIPKSTGGAPFWRADTFFLLHQRPGKKRFIGGEAEIQTAMEKQSFEKLQGMSKVHDPANPWTNPGDGTDGSSTNFYAFSDGQTSPGQGIVYRQLDKTQQSAVLQSAYSDGLGTWAGGDRNMQSTINAKRLQRIKLEETEAEFFSSSRTTNRELITYAQMTHYGYAAAEAVIPGAIVPPENYYMSSSVLKQVGMGVPGLDRATTKDVGGNRLLPMSRSFYTQAIKLAATQGSTWTSVGNESPQMRYWPTPGGSSRTAFFTKHRLSPRNAPLWSGPTGGTGRHNHYYQTGSDQAKTSYMADIFNQAPASAVCQPAKLFRADYNPNAGKYFSLEVGIFGSNTGRGTGALTTAPNTWTNPMFQDPGAGSGNGNFWRFAEYDSAGDVNGSSTADLYSGKQSMRKFRWQQWFENPVYGGARRTYYDTSITPASEWLKYTAGNATDRKVTGGTGNDGSNLGDWGVTPGVVPVAELTDAAVNISGSNPSGGYAGGKLNFMQIDWRYQCGTHYNSALDSAPIGLTAGPRYRTNETAAEWTSRATANRPSTKGTYPWYIVGGHSATGSDYIASMVSSASQPWHGTAITRSGFSVITSPTTPVPSGTHPDWSQYGNFHSAGRITSRGGFSGYCSVFRPAILRQDIQTSGSDDTKLNSWMQEGLSRDLDIEVGWNFAHSRKDLNGGIAGFTILTASTVSPPGDLSGRFNGDHKIRATFKERRLLNAGKFRVSSPVKTSPVIPVDSSHLFCFTAPAKSAFLIGTGAVSQTTSGDSFGLEKSFGDNTRFSNDRIWWRATGVSNSFIGQTQATNYKELVGSVPTLASARRYVTSIAGNKPINRVDAAPSSSLQTLQQQSDLKIPQFAPGPGIFRTSFGPNQNWMSSQADPSNHPVVHGRQLDLYEENQTGIENALPNPKTVTQGSPPVNWSNQYTPFVSQSLSIDEPATGMYLLMPGDELILGFQPSLHGSNRGNSTIPTNPNVNPYGPWRDGIVDRHQIPTGSAYNPEWNPALNANAGGSRPEIIDSKGEGGYHLRRGPNKVIGGKSINNANMEALHEPRSSFTIKSSTSAKLVLYGTLLRDNKHVPPQSNQQLRTDAVHQAIMGGPVVDQFQVEPTYMYTGSYIARHVTGSITLTQRNRADMNLVTGSQGFGPSIIGSAYNPLSKNFIKLGGPEATKNEFIRQVYRPNARENAKLWQGYSAGNLANAPSSALNMGISGSVQRFVRLSDDSEFFYDSFPPSTSEFHNILIKRRWGPVDGPAQGLTVFAGEFTMFNFQVGGPTTVLLGRPAVGVFSSFPFENKFSSIKREIIFDTSLQTSGSRMYSAVDGCVPPRNEVSSVDIAIAIRQAEGPDASRYRLYSGQPGGAGPASIPDTRSGTNLAMTGSYKTGPGGAFWGNGSATDLKFGSPNGAGGIYDQVVPLPSKIDLRGAAGMPKLLTWGHWKSVTGDSPQATLASSKNGMANFPYELSPQTNLDDTGSGLVFDHPSGWKYGLMNCQKTKTSAVFRSDRYGQLRDMLEQRAYTKFFDQGDQFTPAGLQESAVSCIFVDGDGDPIEDPLLTSCLNMSSEMTSSIPYKEGETQRTFLFNSQLVTISPLVQSFAASPFMGSLT